MIKKSWVPAVAAVLESLGLPAAVTEYAFATPQRKWRFDFAWPGRFLALEIEGGIFTHGRHTRGKGFEADMEKYNEAALLGWRVLRVSPGMLADGRAFELLGRAFQ